MPGTLGSAIYGLIGGLVGAIVMGIIMNLMAGKVKTTPPKLLAAKFLGSAKKNKQMHFAVMSIWGIIYGLVLALTAFANTVVTALVFSLIPWAVLGFIMLPMAGAGVFATKKEKKTPVMALILHLIWGLAVWLSYLVLVALIG